MSFSHCLFLFNIPGLQIVDGWSFNGGLNKTKNWRTKLRDGLRYHECLFCNKVSFGSWNKKELILISQQKQINKYDETKTMETLVVATGAQTFLFSDALGAWKFGLGTTGLIWKHNNCK